MSGYFWRTHRLDYADRFGETLEDDSLISMFKFNPGWGKEHKVVYEPKMITRGLEYLETNRTNFAGIFVNYEKVRSAFIGSASVGESIQKVLNMVNAATSGILKLKMRYMESFQDSDTSSSEIVRVSKIKVYDENALPAKDDAGLTAQPYRFFEGNVSEAMSYNFDFSLPGSVAATVMANTFEPTEMSAAGGDPETKALISYGYALDSNLQPALRSLVMLDTEVTGHDCIKTVPRRDADSATVAKETDAPESQSLEDIEQDDFYRNILGYKELDPPKMKEKAARNGLFNVIPSAGKINIKLQGLDGFKFGDMFTVHNVLPYPYDDNNIFMVTGYKHDISSQGWFTDLEGTMIASIPDNIKEIQKALRAAEDNADSTPNSGT